MFPEHGCLIDRSRAIRRSHSIIWCRSLLFGHETKAAEYFGATSVHPTVEDAQPDNCAELAVSCRSVEFDGVQVCWFAVIGLECALFGYGVGALPFSNTSGPMGASILLKLTGRSGGKQSCWAATARASWVSPPSMEGHSEWV